MENKAGTTEHFSKRGAGWLTSNCTLPPRLHRPWKKLRWKRLCSDFCVFSFNTINRMHHMFENGVVWISFQPECKVATYSRFSNNSLYTGSPDVVCRYSLTWTKEVDRCWSRRYSTEVPVWRKLLPSSLTIRGPVEQLFSPQTRAWPVCSGPQKYHNMFSFFLEIDCLYKWKQYGSFQFARNNPIILRLK